MEGRHRTADRKVGQGHREPFKAGKSSCSMWYRGNQIQSSVKKSFSKDATGSLHASTSLYHQFLREYSFSCSDKTYLLKTHNYQDFINKTLPVNSPDHTAACMTMRTHNVLFSYKFKEFLFPHNLIHVKRFVLRPCVL